MHGRPWPARGLVCLSRRTDRFTWVPVFRLTRYCTKAYCRDHWQASPTCAIICERKSSHHKARDRADIPPSEVIGASGGVRLRGPSSAGSGERRRNTTMYTVSRGPSRIIHRTRRGESLHSHAAFSRLMSHILSQCGNQPAPTCVLMVGLLFCPQI